MSNETDVRILFDSWAKDYHADGMEEEHWPAVSQAVSLLPSISGDYLEVGVGNGYAIRYFAENQFRDGRCFGLDISPEMVRKTRKRLLHLSNVHLEAADFLAWQAPETIRFDLIFSMEVFYYFPDIAKGIGRAAHMLAPGGTLMIGVNFYTENPASHNWPEKLGLPMQLRDKKQYRDAFRAAGFGEVEQKQIAHPGSPEEPGTLVTWGRKDT